MATPNARYVPAANVHGPLGAALGAYQRRKELQAEAAKERRKDLSEQVGTELDLLKLKSTLDDKASEEQLAKDLPDIAEALERGFPLSEALKQVGPGNAPVVMDLHKRIEEGKKVDRADQEAAFYASVPDAFANTPKIDSPLVISRAITKEREFNPDEPVLSKEYGADFVGGVDHLLDLNRQGESSLVPTGMTSDGIPAGMQIDPNFLEGRAVLEERYGIPLSTLKNIRNAWVSGISPQKLRLRLAAEGMEGEQLEFVGNYLEALDNTDRGNYPSPAALKGAARLENGGSPLGAVTLNDNVETQPSTAEYGKMADGTKVTGNDAEFFHRTETGENPLNVLRGQYVQAAWNSVSRLSGESKDAFEERQAKTVQEERKSWKDGVDGLSEVDRAISREVLKIKQGTKALKTAALTEATDGGARVQALLGRWGILNNLRQSGFGEVPSGTSGGFNVKITLAELGFFSEIPSDWATRTWEEFIEWASGAPSPERTKAWVAVANFIEKSVDSMRGRFIQESYPAMIANAFPGRPALHILASDYYKRLGGLGESITPSEAGRPQEGAPEAGTTPAESPPPDLTQYEAFEFVETDGAANN